MVCTIAIQEKISEQYQKQAYILVEDEGDLHAIVKRFRDEKLEHREIAVYYDGREARHYKSLRTIVQSGYRVVIKIAERVQAV